MIDTLVVNGSVGKDEEFCVVSADGASAVARLMAAIAGTAPDEGLRPASGRQR